MLDETHDPQLRSWVESANEPLADFPIQNLPFCRFRRPGEERTRAGVAIGDQVLDIGEDWGIASVAAVMAMPAAARTDLRRRLSRHLANYTPGADRFLYPVREIELLLPCEIGNYTDFYASLHHATNVGALFRTGNPLAPNYKWIPIAYHGRASSVVVSGTPVRRPWGQVAEDRAGPPVFTPSRKLDYEVELGAFLGPGNRLGEPIRADQAFDHIAGVVLLNDWSARDIQVWEYQPLGPFLSKSFATSISPWIVTTGALEPFRCVPEPRPTGDPQPLPYLCAGSRDAFDIVLELWLRSPHMQGPVMLSRGRFRSMYWTLTQMLAHHTSNGCPICPGDLIGSGTVSGPEKSNRGCLLELTARGAEPVALPSGEKREFLEDGDEVTLRGWCEAPGFRRIGLGECRGVIEPAIAYLS
ncbi:MAG: fumarylacetoacetase [Terriglobia bacterium]|nr:MAG: fumarylacetoacetase [Terriglobia bacterium]